jgi:hypothetical protein
MALKAVSAPLGSPVGGSGTTGTIPVWSSGTTLGDSPLTVSGSNVTGAGAIRATGTSAAAPAFTGSDTDTGMYFPAANQVRFSTAGALAIAIDASQNVGIGTASPSAKLEVPFTGSLAGMRIQIGSANYFNATNHFFRTLGDNNLVQISGNYIDASFQANYGLRLPATPGVGDANTLDAYREGTRVLAAGDLSGWTYVTATQYWTLVGRTVTLHTVFTGGTSSATGGATIATPPLLTPLRIAAGVAVNSAGTALGNGVAVVGPTSGTTGTVTTSNAISSSAVDKVITVTYETAGL